MTRNTFFALLPLLALTTAESSAASDLYRKFRRGQVTVRCALPAPDARNLVLTTRMERPRARKGDQESFQSVAWLTLETDTDGRFEVRGSQLVVQSSDGQPENIFRRPTSDEAASYSNFDSLDVTIFGNRAREDHFAIDVVYKVSGPHDGQGWPELLKFDARGLICHAN